MPAWAAAMEERLTGSVAPLVTQSAEARKELVAPVRSGVVGRIDRLQDELTRQRGETV